MNSAVLFIVLVICRLVLAHRDFASLEGLRDADAALAQVSVLHRQVRFGFTHLSVAHVKSDDITAVPHHEAAHTRGDVHHAAALPLTNVDLKRPQNALIENKGADLVVLIVPVNKQRKTLFYRPLDMIILQR